MNQLSLSEENYLKAIFSLGGNEVTVSTRAIAQQLNAKDSSVTDMMKKLAVKNLVNYVRYKGVNLTDKGLTCALVVIRRHRLWEVFLVQKLGFTWDKVHDIAEQLEHIQSPELLNRLDEFLDFPEADPHGDPIPNKIGEMPQHPRMRLTDVECGTSCTIVRVMDDSPEFLTYLDATGIGIGDHIRPLQRIGYDHSLRLELQGKGETQISRKVSDQILVDQHQE